MSQTTAGEMADFNMWQHEMTADEVVSQTCGAYGSVSTWSTLQEKGISRAMHKDFRDCQGK